MEEAFLPILATPKSSCNKIVGWKDQELKVKIAAPPEKGAANDELIAFMSKLLKIGKSNIEIVQGKESRHKRLKIKGISLEQLKNKLKELE